jgi:hypothetical protein
MLRKPACGAVLASLVALLATGCGSDEETEPFTTTGHGTVAVSDRRGDTDTPEMDIVRARLTLRRGWFVARITTDKPVKEYDSYLISGISAMVNIQSAGEDWTIDGNYWENGDGENDDYEESTSCEAVEGINFEHKQPCQVRFDGRIATIKFKASLIAKDDSVQVYFETAKSHETDYAPDVTPDNDEVKVELVVVE